MISTESKNKKADAHRPDGAAIGWLRSLVKDNLVATVLAMIVLVPLMTGTALLNDAGKVAVFEILGSLLLLLTVSQMKLSAEACAKRCCPARTALWRYWLCCR